MKLSDGGADFTVLSEPTHALIRFREGLMCMTCRSERSCRTGGALVLVVAALAFSSSLIGAPAQRGAGPAEWTNDVTPIPASAWSYDFAAHLIERAGFGGTPEEIERLAAMTPQQAVDWLVDYEAIDNADLKPFDESGIGDVGMDPFPESRAEAVRIARERGAALGEKLPPEGSPRRLQPVVDKFFYGLRSNVLETQRLALWWANRMLRTKRPLEETLTLFWHGHFATGQNKVRDYRMMLRQNVMFRERASATFRDLLIGILKDPAMLVYLDNGENVKSHPNENFGRELLELFTMGVGNYTERDIRDASRAFTGWTNKVLEFSFDDSRHDFGAKTFLGRTDNFNGDAIIDRILEQEVTADFMAAKFYRYFVRDDVADPMKVALGRTFRDSGYRVKPLVKQIFLSKDFYSPPSYATQIKSPVHLVVSTFKKLGLTEVPTIPDFGRLTASLGQTLFEPPNVAGWAAGRTWITASTLLQRGNLFREVLFPDVAAFRPPDRQIPGIYAAVGERLAKGMSIGEATKGGDAEANMMADRDEDYNTRYGGYMGYVLAFKRVKAVPRHPAEISLSRMIQAAGANTVDGAVDHFIDRFLSVPLAANDRTVLVDFLRKELGADSIPANAKVEEALRRLLYLVLSTPEYQLG